MVACMQTATSTVPTPPLAMASTCCDLCQVNEGEYTCDVCNIKACVPCMEKDGEMFSESNGIDFCSNECFMAGAPDDWADAYDPDCDREQLYADAKRFRENGGGGIQILGLSDGQAEMRIRAAGVSITFALPVSVPEAAPEVARRVQPARKAKRVRTE